MIELSNQTFIDIVGKGSAIVGKPFAEALPELESQGYLRLLNQVYATGELHEAKAARADVLIDGVLKTSYYDYTYKPLFDANGDVYAIMCMAVDVTEAVLARLKIEESEAQFRSLIEEAPVATCLFVGREMRIDIANDTMISYWGKGRAVLGQPLVKALPELIGQPFLELLDNVFTTGNTYEAKAARAELVVDGVPGTYYFDYTYKPLRNAAGEVYAIMDMAVDVTEEVKSRRRIEEAEASLRGAIELAELGTWELDVTTNTVTYSDRIKSWFGFTDDALNQKVVYNPIHEKDRDRVQQELERQVVERTRQLQTSVADLQRSNQNLQQFAYVASHDLQEPLRKIQSFGDLLQSQYADRLGEGIDHLQRMQTAACRMSVLIKDLLTFSRISTQQKLPQLYR